MTKQLLILLALVALTPGYAQKQHFSYRFYGQVRGDLFYNSRANAEIVDGLFHLYPKDIAPDAEGNDLHAAANGSFYLLYSRLGIDVAGPKVGRAATSVKVEADFRGAGSSWAMLRIRHAYVNLDWGKSSLLIGQTWHPLFGDIFPQMLNLSTGAPFQPFSRAPQLRYRYQNGHLRLTGAALWQLQYLSAGPEGKSEAYIKNSCLPEIFLGVDYQADGWTAGIGMELLSLVPRTQSEVGNKVYKVTERITTLSGEAHAKYQEGNWTVMGKTLLGNNLTQACMLGGYGVTDTDPRTGQQTYSPYLYSTTWLNVVYGKKWQPGLFVGYLKNLGASSPLVGKTYGVGLDVDQLLSTNVQLAYNLPHWKIGVEYSPSIAWYGEIDPKEGGRIHSTHAVTNHRLLGVAVFSF